MCLHPILSLQIVLDDIVCLESLALLHVRESILKHEWNGGDIPKSVLDETDCTSVLPAQEDFCCSKNSKNRQMLSKIAEQIGQNLESGGLYEPESSLPSSSWSGLYNLLDHANMFKRTKMIPHLWTYGEYDV